jgi:hypothetical protein
MLRIPRRHGHFVFGVIQSGLTCALAAAIASYPFVAHGGFIAHWIAAWLLSWLMMLPVVILAAPAIRRLTDMLTQTPDGGIDARDRDRISSRDSGHA